MSAGAPGLKSEIKLGLIGLGLCALALAALALTPGFHEAIPLRAQPVLWLVALQVMAGTLYLFLPGALGQLESRTFLLVWGLAIGLLLRGLALSAEPLLEDDFQRYLWDGGVVAAGLDPYATAPAQVSDSPALSGLAAAGRARLERINHPELRTIYPPGAQAAFALAHLIEHWSLGAWRGLLLAADLASLGLLLAILGHLGRSPLWALVYWWNPLVVQQIFNAGHMDLLLVPFLLGALWLALTRRLALASLALALAATVKLWPALLLPITLRGLLRDRPKLALTGLACLLLVAAAVAPIARAGLDPGSGLFAFATTWAANDALNLALSRLLGDPVLARLLLAGALVGFALWLNRQPAGSDQALVERFTLLVAAVFLLSPAQFPWYAVPLVPLLALWPLRGLLLLSALLPLYGLRFYLVPRDLAPLFDHAVVWLEYLPVWALLLLEWHGRSRSWRHTRCATA